MANFPVQTSCANMTNAVGTNDTDEDLGLTHHALEMKINKILDILKAAGVYQDNS